MNQGQASGSGLTGIAMIWVLRVLVVLGIGLVGLAIWEQPRVADDWYLAWKLEDLGSLGRFLEEMYFGWGGRLLPFALGGLALSSEAATYFFKLLTIPCFMFVAACACFLTNGTLPRLERDLLPMAAVLWLGAPVVSDTVVQTTGAAAYLWPAAAGLFMLCLFRRARDRANLGDVSLAGKGVQFCWLVFGVLVGTGNEQLIAGMFTVLAGWGWMLWRSGRLRHVAPEAWWGLAGLIFGTLILVGAPGNYVRLGVPETGGGVFSMLVRYAMYLGGAYFGLGTGDAGRALWLGISVIALSGVLTLNGDRGRDSGIWIAASLATLAPMLPLVNFASPRTTFLAAIFLVIAVTTAFPRKPVAGAFGGVVNLGVAYALAMLVLLDGMVGWTANRALAVEMAARHNTIALAVADGRKEVVIPHLATIPSRLTFMLNPLYDQEFGAKLAGRQGLNRSYEEQSSGIRLPHTFNSLKALKNSF